MSLPTTRVKASRGIRWLLIGLLYLTSQAVCADTFDFNIQAQPLPSALGLFGKQSGYQISAEASLLEGLMAKPVIGVMPASQAINRLLDGTNLDWYLAAGNTVVIQVSSQSKQEPALLSPILVSAQDIPSETDEAFSSPSSASYISQRKIERFRGTSVGDIFQSETGVLVGENRNSGGLDINIRGMQGQGRVPVLVDGSRQETTVYRGYAGVSSRTYIDPDLIGGIDIQKGPTLNASATGATGGLVSMRTLTAEDLLKPGQDWSIRLRAGASGNNSGSPAAPGTWSGLNPGGLAGGGVDGAYRVDCVTASLCEGPYDLANALGTDDTLNRPGTFDLKGWSGSVALAKRFEFVDLVAAHAQRRQGNYYAGKHGPTPSLNLSDRVDRGFWTEVRPKLEGASRFRAEELIANSNFENKSTLLKSLFYLPDDHSIELGYQHYTSTYGELMPSQLTRLGQVRQTEGSEVEVDTYTSRYQWEPFGSPYVDLGANLWHTDTASINRNYSEELSFGSDQQEDYERWGADVSNTMEFAIGEFLQLEYGLAWQQEKVRTSPLDLGVVDNAGRSGERKEASAFINSSWSPWRWLTLNGGIRYSRFDAEDNQPFQVGDDSAYCTDANNDGACDPVKHENNHSGSAPVASVQLEPWRGIQFYFRYAEALRMPSLFESTSGFSSEPALDVTLKPEHAKNREVGLNILQDNLFSSSDEFRLKLSYFQNRTEDYLTRTTPNVWEEGADQRFFVTRNINSVEFHGAELNLQYDAGIWYTELGGTRYNHIEVCHFGSYRRERCNNYGIADSYINNMIPPNWHASATLGTRLFSRTLDLGLRGTWMGERNEAPEYDDATKSGFLQPVPWHSYEILDLYVSYQPNDTVTVDFNIDNLTDRYYLDALSLGLVPAPGRTVRIGTTLSF